MVTSRGARVGDGGAVVGGAAVAAPCVAGGSGAVSSLPSLQATASDNAARAKSSGCLTRTVPTNRAGDRSATRPMSLPSTPRLHGDGAFDALADGGGGCRDVRHDAGEHVEVQGLGAVAESMLGAGGYLQDQAIGTGGDHPERYRLDQAALAGTVAGGGDDGKGAELLHERDGVDVHGVAGGGLEGADAALAEDDVGVALGEDVLGGEEPLLDGGGHAALQEDGLL